MDVPSESESGSWFIEGRYVRPVIVRLVTVNVRLGTVKLMATSDISQ